MCRTSTSSRSSRRIGETIPIVGPIIGGLTAVAVALTVSPQLALTVGVYFLVLHQLEANILVPKIMEQRVGVSPVAVMVALLDRRRAVGPHRRDSRDSDRGHRVRHHRGRRATWP